MEICIIGRYLNPPFNEANTTLARELGIQLTNLGHSVHLVTDSCGALPLEQRMDGLYFHRIPSRLFPFSAVKKMVGLSERYHFDIVHCQNIAIAKSFIMMASLKKRLNVPVVAYVCLQPSLSLTNWMFALKNDIREGMFRIAEFTPRIITKAELAMVDQVVTSSDFLKKKIAETTKREIDEIEVILPFINFANFTQLTSNVASTRSGLGVSGRTPLLLFAGTHLVFRGEMDFLRAFALLLDEYPQSKALLLVSSHFPKRIRKLIKSLKIENSLLFLNGANSRNVATLMAASDAYIYCGLSSLSGGSIDPPLTIIEAMALEKPCVAYNSGGVRELHKFGNLRLVEPQNIDELASRMSQVLKEKRSDIHHQGKNRTVCNTFDSKVATKRFLAVYEKAGHR